MLCNCEKYNHLELSREAIDNRIKQTKKIKKSLEKIASQQNGYFELWKCSECNQLWQSSKAWNWSAKEYIYKVPKISVENWIEEPFIQPDELLIYSAVLEQFEARQTFVERNEKCRKENCDKNAIQFTVFCKKHHIESLQNGRGLPDFPKGRMFAPYNSPYN